MKTSDSRKHLRHKTHVFGVPGTVGGFWLLNHPLSYEPNFGDSGCCAVGFAADQCEGFGRDCSSSLGCGFRETKARLRVFQGFKPTSACCSSTSSTVSATSCLKGDDLGQLGA